MAWAPSLTLGADAQASPTLGFGFSLYGMKSLPLDEALTACAKIGYDCVELPVMAGWPADAITFSLAEQGRLRGLLEQTGLRLASLMENLVLATNDAQHASNLQRLAAAGKLARRLAPEGPRIIETILGGQPDQWEAVKPRMVERLRDWTKAAEDGDFTLAIKAHVRGALHTPEDAAWLVQQTESRHVRAAFDYSHFQLRGVDLETSIRTLIPYTAFVHVKDAQGDANRFQFLLPGEGATDYDQYLKLLAGAAYRGDIVVEVSGQIHNRPDYQPLAAARRCFEKLAPAFAQINRSPGEIPKE